MLSGLVTWVLNTYIGEYVENLNADQITIGIFQGQVELENLPLKRDALKHLGLPVEVKSGFIGKVQLQIPVRRLQSEKWIITLDKLYLVAGPATEQQYDEETVKQMDLERKKTQLKALEDDFLFQKSLIEQSDGAVGKSDSWWSYGTSLITNIIENLQLNVKDVHIRYEDETTASQSFAFGIIINSMSMQSANANWLPGFVSLGSSNVLNKLVDLQGFSVYWDRDVVMIGALPRAQLQETLEKSKEESASSHQLKDHEYLLEPVSAQARLRRNTSSLPLRSLSTPRLCADVTLEGFMVALTDTQYRGMVALLKEIDRCDSARKYRCFRPNCPVKNNAKLWWKFAIDSHLFYIRENRRRQTKDFITKRAKDLVAYVEAYEAYLNVGQRYLSSQHSEIKSECEESWMFEELKIAQQIVTDRLLEAKRQEMKELVKTSTVIEGAGGSKAPEGQTMMQRWFPGWGGWYGSGQTPSDGVVSDVDDGGSNESAILVESTSEEIKISKREDMDREIFDTIADTVENSTFLKQDMVFAQLNFCLQKSSFKLLTTSATSEGTEGTDRSCILELECDSVRMNLESRPRTGGLKFGVSVQDLCLRDKRTVHSLVPTLISSLPRTLSGTRHIANMQDEYSLFELIYEKKPLQYKADYRLSIRTKSLDIVYNPQAIKSVKDFFTIKKSKEARMLKSELQIAAAARNRYEAFKKLTQDELRSTIDAVLESDDKTRSKRWVFDFDVSAPQIRLLESFTDDNSTIVVFDLGHLEFCNKKKTEMSAMIGSQAGSKTVIQDDDDLDDFVTPSSSPPHESNEFKSGGMKVDSISDFSNTDLTDSAFREKIYETYHLNLSDLQVMVGRFKENWKLVRHKGTSLFHVVDKFSIALQFERRLIYMTDPRFPQATLSGSLPSLMLHVNEQKIQALRLCSTLLLSPMVLEDEDEEENKEDDDKLKLNKSLYYSVYPGGSDNKSTLSIPDKVDGDQASDAQSSECQGLIIVCFSIDMLTLAIQSRGQSIAELQVSKVRSTLTRRPLETSVCFSVHSLLIVDAVQTLGPDFELLVASHKNICLDSHSGSILDSKPNSPASPQSPVSPSSPAEIDLMTSSPSMVQSVVTSVLQSLTLTATPESARRHNISTSVRTPLPAVTTLAEDEALIKIEVDVFHSKTGSQATDETLCLANVEFNSLDVIANQQTIVELMSFFHRILPTQVRKTSVEKPVPLVQRVSETSHEAESDQPNVEDPEFNAPPGIGGTKKYRPPVGDFFLTLSRGFTRRSAAVSTAVSPAGSTAGMQKTAGTTSGSTAVSTAGPASKNQSGSGWGKRELTANFHRLNVLLMRVEERGGGVKVPHKVAMVTLCEAKIQAAQDEQLEVKGSLCGLQLLDLTPEGKRHQQVFSVGIVPGTYRPNDSSFLLRMDSFDATAFSGENTEQVLHKAFTFSFNQTTKSLKNEESKEGQPQSSDTYQSFQSSNASQQRTVSPTNLSTQEITIVLRLASVGYLHAPNLLRDLSLCFTEFHGYVKKFSESIRTRATELALGLMYKSTMGADLNAAAYGSNWSLDKSAALKRADSVAGVDVTFDNLNGSGEFDADVNKSEPSPVQQLSVKVDAILDTPVVLVPKNPSSSEVISLHLGKIVIRNWNPSSNEAVARNDVISVEISDMSAYSLDLEKIARPTVSGSMSNLHVNCGDTVTFSSEWYHTTRAGTPILHDTMIELSLEKVNPLHKLYDGDDSCDEAFDLGSTQEYFKVVGRVVGPLKLVLTKSIYEQILKTVDNLTPSDDIPSTIASESMLNLSSRSEKHLDGSLSALKFDTSASEPLDETVSVVSADALPVLVRVKFEMPIFSVRMMAVLGERECGLVELRLENFTVGMTADRWFKTLDLYLQTLVLEDLLQPEGCERRELMVSRCNAVRPTSRQGAALCRDYLSSSCPTSIIDMPPPPMSPSLPSSLNVESNVFLTSMTRVKPPARQRKSYSTSEYPCTPPPSRTSSPTPPTDNKIPLVHMKVKLVDKKCPDFVEKYNSTNRIVCVDFNSLETSVNLETWVLVLEFLGIGKCLNPEEFTLEAQETLTKQAQQFSTESSVVQPQEEVINTEVDLKVQSFSLVLHKKDYQLARADASSFACHVSLHDGNMDVKGQLGKLSLIDSSPHGRLYRERFITTGTNAVDFHFFKYGTPDPDSLRDCDATMTLSMASVYYIHTQRFVMETLAFIQNFNQLQDLLGRSSAASAGKKIAEKAFRNARVSLNLTAGAPVILIPQSSRNTEVLVLVLGRLRVTNEFLMDGSSGTASFRKREEQGGGKDLMGGKSEASGGVMSQSVYGSLEADWRLAPPLIPTISNQGCGVNEEGYRCLLDVVHVKMEDMEVYSAQWSPLAERDGEETAESDLFFPSFVIKREDGRILREKCRLVLQVERNLDVDISHTVPDISIDGKLSSVYITLDSLQYQLIRGLLNYNFGEPLEEFQKQLMLHLKDPKILPVLSGEVTVGLAVSLDLDGVQVEMVLAHEDKDVVCPEISLVRFDFIRSRLLMESRTDGSKDIDLVSHEIKVHDTRFRDSPVNVRPNVFSEILRPSSDRSCPSSLQLELHCRTNKDTARFTVLLNNMRVMGVFDWLVAVADFIMVSPPDPFLEDKAEMDRRMKQSVSAGSYMLSTSGGITTKRIPVIEKREQVMELCLNMTETEFVVVENASCRDTNAIILKGTTVLKYREVSERPLSCSLQSLEVFSCSLAAEDETALSIIDPMSLLLELNSSPVVQDRKIGLSAGLLDAATCVERPPILEITFQSLSIRLSYNDVKLFTAILNSMPQQLLKASGKTAPKNTNFSEWQVSRLKDIGFSKSDCEKALEQCKGQLDNAAVWLTKNSTPVVAEKPSGLNISGFEVKEGNISICLIDDCLDADIPLLELNFLDIYVLHKFRPQGQGKAKLNICGDYYNRSLSGWEPFLESWRCNVEWHNEMLETKEKLYLEISAPPYETLNVNVTSTLLDLYSKTKEKWTDDYKKNDESKDSTSMYNSRRRIPFIPFAIRNETGCRIKFKTLTSLPSRVDMTSVLTGDDSRLEDGWKEVSPGAELPFLVDGREKIRHKHTHELKVHQMVLKVEGWESVTPVSVDKVGVYFRRAEPDRSNASRLYPEMPPARVVFEVTIEGSARKLITVRSSLILDNQLEDTLEVKLETPTTSSSSGKGVIMHIEPHTRMPLPLKFVHSTIFVRPHGWSLTWCHTPIRWQQVTRGGETQNSSNSCDTRGAEQDAYRFCCSIYRQHFPEESVHDKHSQCLDKAGLSLTLPGHIISIVPPLHIVNLLPIELTYTIRLHDKTSFNGTVKPGKKACHIAVDLTQLIHLSVTLENYPQCSELVIPPGSTDYRVKICVLDAENRPLELLVHVKTKIGDSLQLTIQAAYWLINRSGLPLIFKEDGSNQMSSGQFAEHELARSVTPLLFSFMEKDNTCCSMRLGKSVHGPGTNPTWCSRFRLVRGVTVSQVHVAQPSRPDWVYYIGIEVRPGRGRYSDTSIVTFTPRFQLDNRSSHKLAYTQRHLAKSLVSNEYLTALPKCVLPFHWPRVDLDTLLCVRLMDQSTCQWSGGVIIDSIDSFHINMREENNRCVFLRVDVVLVGATYVAVFSDADQMPPPYRIDNFAEVPVLFYQSKNSNDKLRTYIKPRTSVPYAFDEPTLLPHITLKVPSGSGASYDMNLLGDGEKLCYENFIYIAFTHTFRKHTQTSGTSKSDYNSFVESQQLVLDVTPNMNVILKRKEPGKRSQLWRMTSSGMLQHEGTSVPRDPRNPSYSSSVIYVLDIKDIALQPNRDMPLALRKPDDRRRSTQIWKFTNGQLSCGERTRLYVQAKDGMFGLRDGGEAVLGSVSPTPKHQGQCDPPPESAIHREKQQPGSGFLVVKVIMDGPTHVLQITDVAQQKYEGKSVDDWLVVEEARKKPELRVEAKERKTSSSEVEKSNQRDFEISVNLPAGIGISLIDSTPEEIVYISLRDVQIDYNFNDSEQILKADVKNFQVDNQVFGCYKSVLMYVTQLPRKDSSTDSAPALHICAHKMPHNNWNAEIFKQLLITIKPLTVPIEEVVLWKLLRFLGYHKMETEMENFDESNFNSSRAVSAAASADFKRYYFGAIKINKCDVMLSVLTTHGLPPDLYAIKRSLKIPLIRFEDANVELDPFVKLHLFETSAFLLESIRQHYTNELKGQATRILGSVDFLGNPLGLFTDMAEGVSVLLEGNVRGLLNVTHGFSNSAAKISGTLSDNVGAVTWDKHHQYERQKIISQSREEGSRGGPLMAGVKGFFHGVIGGITSIPRQTYTGITEDGATGLVSGLAKGIIGTVTKPVVGVLDLTSGTASAIRDTSKGFYFNKPVRVRKARCCHGRGGLLAVYNSSHAEAQELLLNLNQHNYKEVFVALDELQADEGLQALISTLKLYCLCKDNSVLLVVSYDELISCQTIHQDGKFYIQLTTVADRDASVSGSLHEVAKKRPLVKCDTEKIANEVVHHVMYAKNLHDELKHTLPPDPTLSVNDLTP